MKYWNDRLFDDGKDYCTWVFRPGYDGIHFAKARCDGDFKELSIRIRDPKPGCADWYNGRRCPVCRRPIKIDYCPRWQSMDSIHLLFTIQIL